MPSVPGSIGGVFRRAGGNFRSGCDPGLRHWSSPRCRSFVKPGAGAGASRGASARGRTAAPLRGDSTGEKTPRRPTVWMGTPNRWEKYMSWRDNLQAFTLGGIIDKAESFIRPYYTVRFGPDPAPERLPRKATKDLSAAERRARLQRKLPTDHWYYIGLLCAMVFVVSLFIPHGIVLAARKLGFK